MPESRSLGEELIEAAREMVAIHRGEKQPVRVHYRELTGPDTDLIGPPFYTPRKIRVIREKVGVSQARFAKLMNCKASTVKAWEQDIHEPNDASRRLLQIADRHPEALLATAARTPPGQEEAPAATTEAPPGEVAESGGMNGSRPSSSEGLIEMPANEESFGQKVAQALREMVAVHRGEMEPARVTYRELTGPDTDLIGPPFYTPRKIREIREKMGVSQGRFAKLMNCKESTVKAWEEEENVREPNAASRRLLQIAEQHPEVLLSVSRWPEPEESETPGEEPKLRRAG